MSTSTMSMRRTRGTGTMLGTITTAPPRGVTAATDRPASGSAFAAPARPRRSTQPAAGAPHARLTRRGRAVALLLLVLVLLAAFSLGRVASQAAPSVGAKRVAPYAQTTVQPGDTLWSVAQRIAPANDPRDVVAQIRRINGLETAQIQAGQQLLLPVAT